MNALRTTLIAAMSLGIAATLVAPAVAGKPPSRAAVATGQPFPQYVEKLRSAIVANRMGIVAEACAHCGAQKVLGRRIPGNRVVMIFHPRFAVRMLDANVAAGIEAPLRLYLTEQPDGTAHLVYERPSSTFGQYDGEGLAELAAELDIVVDRIVQQSLRD